MTPVASLIADAAALVYPTRRDVIACARMLRDELREDLDCDPTGQMRIVSADDAGAVLATSESGEHVINLRACPHARPGDPLCDACLAVAAKAPRVVR